MLDILILVFIYIVIGIVVAGFHYAITDNSNEDDEFDAIATALLWPFLLFYISLLAIGAGVLELGKHVREWIKRR